MYWPKKTSPGTISRAGKPSSTSRLTTCAVELNLSYIRAPSNVAGTSGAGVVP